MAIKIHKPTPSSLVITFTRTYIIYTTVFISFVAVISMKSYYNTPYSRLSCITHPPHHEEILDLIIDQAQSTVISNRLTSVEDNDCSLVRSALSYSKKNGQSILWRLRSGQGFNDRRVEFAFEVEDVFVGIAEPKKTSGEDDSLFNYTYFGLKHDEPSGYNFQHIQHRKFQSIEKKTHRHVILEEMNQAEEQRSMTEGEVLEYIKNLGNSCEMSVLIKANNHRIFSFYEYPCPGKRKRKAIKSIYSYNAFDVSRVIADYLYDTEAESDRKHRVTVNEDKSTFRLFNVSFFILSLVIFLIYPQVREKVELDPVTGTLSISRSSIIFLGHEKPTLVCALENLVGAKVKETNVVQMQGKFDLVTLKEYRIELFLSGSAVSPPSPNRNNNYRGVSSSSENDENTIVIDEPYKDDAELRRVCETLNDLVSELNGIDPREQLALNNGGNIDQTIRLNDPSNNSSSSTLHTITNRASSSYSQHQPATTGVCVVCLTRNANCVLFPCKHLRTCSHCVLRLTHCPICRTPISSNCTVFV